jgi:cyclophilin family peptidyl-prolyl cis-trans isomerase
LVALILATGVVGCLSKGSAPSQTQGYSDSGADGDQKPGATETTIGQTGSSSAPSTSKRQYAVIETNKGKIVFELYPHKAPKTVENFIKLAKSGFYNGIRWHRVEPGFVIQGGDPQSKDNDPKNDGLGGPGYKIKAEINDVPHLKGTVAMAHPPKDLDGAGSQFYICLDDQPTLDGQFTVFGQVAEGMDVIEKIQVYDTMDKVYIEERE